MAASSVVKMQVEKVLSELGKEKSTVTDGKRDEILNAFELVLRADNPLPTAKFKHRRNGYPKTQEASVRIASIRESLSWLVSKGREQLAFHTDVGARNQTLNTLSSLASRFESQLEVQRHRHTFKKEDGFHASYQVELTIDNGAVTFKPLFVHRMHTLTFVGMLTDVAKLCNDRGLLKADGLYNDYGFAHEYSTSSEARDIKPDTISFRFFELPQGATVANSDCSDILSSHVALVLDSYAAMTGHLLTNGDLVTTRSGVVLSANGRKEHEGGIATAYIGVCHPEDRRLKRGTIIAL